MQPSHAEESGWEQCSPHLPCPAAPGRPVHQPFLSTPAAVRHVLHMEVHVLKRGARAQRQSGTTPLQHAFQQQLCAPQRTEHGHALAMFNRVGLLVGEMHAAGLLWASFDDIKLGSMSNARLSEAANRVSGRVFPKIDEAALIAREINPHCSGCSRPKCCRVINHRNLSLNWSVGGCLRLWTFNSPPPSITLFVHKAARSLQLHGPIHVNCALRRSKARPEHS